MKRLTWLFILLICISTVFFAGCDEQPPHAQVLIVGHHRHFPTANLRDELAYDRILKASETFGDCYVIVSDGAPYVAASYSISKPEKMLDGGKLKQIAKQNTNTIIQTALQSNAKSPETDLLSSFHKACGLLNSSTAVTKEIYVCDNGLSTTGLLNFSERNLIDSSPEDIVSELNRLNSLPGFNGIHVVWTGLGEVVGDEQAIPTAEFKHKLQEIWKAVIYAGGGTVDFYDISLSGENTAELPYCSTVPIIRNDLILDSNTVTPITEEDVQFEKNTALFKDRDKAIEVLTPFAEILTSDRSRVILIAGSTASVGDNAGCTALSLERAEACKTLLCELGVNGNQIKTVGLGRSECSLRVNDIDEKGNLIPDMAAKNRAVFLMDVNSETAKKLM